MSELNKAIVDLAGKINRNTLSNAEYILTKGKREMEEGPLCTISLAVLTTWKKKMAINRQPPGQLPYFLAVLSMSEIK